MDKGLLWHVLTASCQVRVCRRPAAAGGGRAGELIIFERDRARVRCGRGLSPLKRDTLFEEIEGH